MVASSGWKHCHHKTRPPERDAMRNGSCSVARHGGRQLVLPQGGRRTGGVKVRLVRLDPAASWLIWASIFFWCFRVTWDPTGHLSSALICVVHCTGCNGCR